MLSGVFCPCVWVFFNGGGESSDGGESEYEV